jgi:hypothetical protein
VTPDRLPDDTERRVDASLARSLVALAGMPDDASDMEARLVMIARLAVEELPPVSYASVTAVRQGAYTTVAASSQVAVAVDQAQYDEQSGPCLEALNDGVPVTMDNNARTMAWPGFREAAARMGLQASLSIPLFAGGGAPVAALNLYGHDPAAMAVLTAQVASLYLTDPADEVDSRALDGGGQGLIAGLIGAFAVRALIQRAIGITMARRQCSAHEAYLNLRVRAAETGAHLSDVAVVLLQQSSRPVDDHRP